MTSTSSSENIVFLGDIGFSLLPNCCCWATYKYRFSCRDGVLSCFSWSSKSSSRLHLVATNATYRNEIKVKASLEGFYIDSIDDATNLPSLCPPSAPGRM